VNGDFFDLIILVVLGGFVLAGYRLGFVGRVLSWLGVGIGVWVAFLILPAVVPHIVTATPVEQFMIAMAIIIGGAMIGSAIGLFAGASLHRVLPIGPIRFADKIMGAALGAAGLVLLLWLFIPSLAEIPGWPAQAVTNSAISRLLSRELPRPPFDVLRRLVGNGNPEVFSILSPNTASGPPPSASGLSSSLATTISRSTVRVQGAACNEDIYGSGFAVGPDLILTNAHVVAGEPDGATQVLLTSGQVLPASVVMYDPNRDLALLSVPGLGESPLPLAAPQVEQTGGVFGHPDGVAPLYITPARVAQEESAVGPNIYGAGNVSRAILVLASTLAHGDSGGALVDSSGQVIGVAFAINAGSATTAYALNTSEVQQALAEPRHAGTSTQSCLTGG
jgi:S1-C subfamily serine protease